MNVEHKEERTRDIFEFREERAWNYMVVEMENIYIIELKKYITLLFYNQITNETVH